PNGVGEDERASASGLARAKPLTKRLRDRQIRRCRTLLHYFADVFIDFADIDDVNARLRSQIAVIEHRRSGAVIVSGTEQVRATHPIDIPSPRSDLSFRGAWRRISRLRGGCQRWVVLRELMRRGGGHCPKRQHRYATGNHGSKHLSTVCPTISVDDVTATFQKRQCRLPPFPCR